MKSEMRKEKKQVSPEQEAPIKRLSVKHGMWNVGMEWNGMRE